MKRQCTRTPNRADVIGTGITLPGCADMSQAGARLLRLQLCAVLWSSGIKLAEYICIQLYVSISTDHHHDTYEEFTQAKN
jgi:hypothetical protein